MPIMSECCSSSTAKVEDDVCWLAAEPSWGSASNIDGDFIVAAVDSESIPVDFDDNVQDNSSHG